MLTSPRKRIESIVLAVLAIASVIPLRFPVEPTSWFVAEILTVAMLSVGLIAWRTLQERTRQTETEEATNTDWVEYVLTGLIPAAPVMFALLVRRFGTPVAFEMSALTTFGAGALAIALVAKAPRTRAMSLVGSGFLVLFATSISDDRSAVFLAILWMTVCVWHLVANHWEKLDVCMPDQVRRNVGLRPASVLIAVLLCVAGGLAARGRFGPPGRFISGFMPTSGGSKWSDPAARSGIGTGDAAIAAKDHAESFGAVESEIFLESTESTLFDMFNDMIGEPKKRKNKWERRQGMTNENVIPMHERAAKSEQGGGSFSTDRMPPKKHRHFENKLSDAVVQWDGPTGIRLAMERFDTFDGTEWTNSADHANDKLTRQPIEDRVWFFDPLTHWRVRNEDDSVSVDLLKVLRLKSARIPAPMMTSGVHIKKIDRQDFYGIHEDGSLFMPDREKVPPLTVVNLASLSVMEDELLQVSREENEQGERRLIQASGLELKAASPYEQLGSIVEHLRSEFHWDRDATATSDDPVADFLKSRRGGDYMFATAAALMAREIGLRSRIVTGFYVRPDAFDIAAGHADILPSDVHVWTEIQLDQGRWFEIEPTPGFRPPVYTPSLWLTSKRLAQAYWPHVCIAVALGVLAYLTRLIWIECLLTVGWVLSRCLRPRRQLNVAMKIVETRARLIGSARPSGKPQRDWLESLVASDVHLRDHVAEFCDAADGAVFGGDTNIDRRRLTPVVRGLKAKQLKSVDEKVTA